MKTVLFVPGFQEDIGSRDYKAVLRAIARQRFIVEFVPIVWSRTTVEDWVAELNEVYGKHDPAFTILAGFSYGALTALACAANLNPAELWVFSLSPYFSEDLPDLQPSWLRAIGKNRVKAFAKLNFFKLAANIHCPTYIFAGEYEVQQIQVRARTAEQAITRSQFITVPNVGHDVAAPQYIRTIIETIA